VVHSGANDAESDAWENVSVVTLTWVVHLALVLNRREGRSARKNALALEKSQMQPLLESKNFFSEIY